MFCYSACVGAANSFHHLIWHIFISSVHTLFYVYGGKVYLGTVLKALLYIYFLKANFIYIYSWFFWSIKCRYLKTLSLESIFSESWKKIQWCIHPPLLNWVLRDLEAASCLFCWQWIWAYCWNETTIKCQKYKPSQGNKYFISASVHWEPNPSHRNECLNSKWTVNRQLFN